MTIWGAFLGQTTSASFNLSEYSTYGDIQQSSNCFVSLFIPEADMSLSTFNRDLVNDRITEYTLNLENTLTQHRILSNKLRDLKTRYSRAERRGRFVTHKTRDSRSGLRRVNNVP